MIKLEKKKRKAAILFLVFFSFILGASIIYIVKNQNYGYTLSSSYLIPPEELLQKKISALEGNPDNAILVSYHYSYGLNNYDESIRWFSIAAENGHCEGMYSLTLRYLRSINHDLRFRGIFWLRKMAKFDYRDSYAWLMREGYTIDSSQPNEDFLFYNDYSKISDTEIDSFKKSALQGNVIAALFLGNFYSKSVNDLEFAEYWYRIGSQNGSIECMYILGQMMIKLNNEFDQIRGSFWLRQAGIEQ